MRGLGLKGCIAFRVWGFRAKCAGFRGKGLGLFSNEQECGLRDHWGWGFDGIQGLGFIFGPKPRS